MITEAASRLGYPVFLRSDLTSHKQAWERASFAISQDVLFENLRNVVSYSILAGNSQFSTTAVILREYVPLWSSFTAFSGRLPIAAERRYFIFAGKVLCHHPYWAEDMIRNPSVSCWRGLLKTLNQESAEEISLLQSYAELVGDRVRGAWSIDFARTRGGSWILVDMAPARRSSRPDPDCPYCSSLRTGDGSSLDLVNT